LYNQKSEDAILVKLVASIACCALGALLFAGSQSPSQDEEAFKAAYRTEITDGDLDRALQQYAALTGSPNRSVAVRSLQRTAAIYEKTGDARAITVYELIVADFSDQKAAARDASKRLTELRPKSPGAIGWYNGDWQQGIPGLANLFSSKTQFARVYDDFVVPEGGWTVVAVFSGNSMNISGVTKAAWEIRKDMAPGNGGRIVGAGTSRATQTRIPAGPPSRDGLAAYRIQVSGIRVVLAPGRYWVSVAPVGRGASFANATVGRNAIGNPPGDNGHALFSTSDLEFQEAATIGHGGQFGFAKDFSQGVILGGPAK
jgi:hypothetical protein